MKFALLLVLIGVVFVYAQDVRRFTAFYTAEETYAGGSRSFQGRMYYQKNWDGASFGRERLKFVIELASGQVTQNLEELSIWEDQFFKFTICQGSCAWQDIFATEPTPVLFYTDSPDAGVTYTPDGQETVSGTLSDKYIISSRNSVNQLYTDWMTIWVAQSGTRFLTKAEIIYNQGLPDQVIREITFTQPSEAFLDAELDVDPACPSIEPGCFRLDLMFVVDLSGSVGGNVPTEFQFLIDLTEKFVIDAKHFAVGLSSFRDCAGTALRIPLTFNKVQWLADVGSLQMSETAGGWTCIVGGVQRAFDSFSADGRPATSRSLIVITDGNGNRPCSSISIESQPQNNCLTPNGAPGSVPAICANSATPCGNYNANDVPPFYPCCPAFHDYQLKTYYDNNYVNFGSPTVFAIGVGNVDLGTLTQIVYDQDAIASGEPRRFQVTDFQQLNTLIAVLVAAILCDVPGSQECPNDCRPDGFCCAGGCICSVDCNDISTECRNGYCKINAVGAACALTDPQDSICQNSFAFQCQAVFCNTDGECEGTPDDDLTCTDNNLCTTDVCQGGECISSKDFGISDCTDFNGCTRGDSCDENGVCIPGAPNDLGDCTDNNNCTTDACQGGECISTLVVECEDPDTSDCIVPECDAATGECVPRAVEPGAICRASPEGDNCTVYICDEFNKDEYESCAAVSPTDDEDNIDDSDCNRGRCVRRRLNKSECESSEDNLAAIIGGVVAGIVFIAILILLIVIFLLILCRKQVGSVLGSLAGFGPEATVVASPTYVQPAGSGSNDAYDGN